MRIAVDLISVSEDGSAGGAACFALELVRGLSKKCEVIVLCNRYGKRYLCSVLPESVRVVPVLSRKTSEKITSDPRHTFTGRLRLLIRSTCEYASIHLSLSKLSYDLLYCPFAVPTCYRKKTPMVATILDLQHEFFPQFFSPEELAARQKIYRNLVRRAAYLTSISDYTRKVFCQMYHYPRDLIQTVYISIQNRFENFSEFPEKKEEYRKDSTKNADRSKEGGCTLDVLGWLNLSEKQYFLYPANLWEHKNHERLFEAFALFLASGSEETVNSEGREPGREQVGWKLVLTGNEVGRRDILEEKCRELGIMDSVVFAGYVTDEELGSLLRAAKGLIYPSLYEGFGIPIAEAMYMKLPIACSNAGSLPEVGGKAVYYFEPTDVSAIEGGIRYLAKTEMDDKLKERYTEQLKRFSYDKMVNNYFELFQNVLENRKEKSL